jgi:hypothetical protein
MVLAPNSVYLTGLSFLLPPRDTQHTRAGRCERVIQKTVQPSYHLTTLAAPGGPRRVLRPHVDDGAVMDEYARSAHRTSEGVATGGYVRKKSAVVNSAGRNTHICPQPIATITGIMTENLPDYSTVKVPEDKPPEEYSHHERRADLLRRCISIGSPFAVNQSEQAGRYDVHKSQISRDMDRLRESVDESLGDDAKLTTKAVFERALLDLQRADDWRASKAALDAVMDWNEWLADIGEQHREPRQSEVEMDVGGMSWSEQMDAALEGGEVDLGEYQ